MKVKNLLMSMTLLCTLTAFSGYAATGENPANNKATLKEKVAAMSKEQKNARTIELKARVDQIKAMDISQLSIAEKKDLRQELRDIKKEARYLDGRDLAIVILGGAMFSALLLLLIS
jgi:hypothetical protein